MLEVRNRLERPLLRRLTNSRGGPAPLVLYQTGGSGERAAWVLREGPDGYEKPRVAQRISCDGRDYATGDLRWTADGRAVYAVHRERRGPDGGPAPLWCFEWESGRLFITDPAFAPPGVMSILDTADAMARRLWEHGGPGELAVSWRDYGVRGTPLWFWETARWERALPRDG